MRKTIACILTIIYLSFSAGSLLHVQGSQIFDFVSIQSFSVDTDTLDTEPRDTSSHIKIVNFHKAHKHLAASRNFQIQRVSATGISTAIHTSSIIAADRKYAPATSTAALSHSPLYLKNCVLRV
jgi:hypothetical protein